ncbi:uncharacterized protein LOC143651551 [Tamandua tetradactyla]|uniref:uncharacterized protein LOC143651551 n=1 Tax=Tamandua tetradactyla TaxID=48850 RepID=UPI0040548484
MKSAGGKQPPPRTQSAGPSGRGVDAPPCALVTARVWSSWRWLDPLPREVPFWICVSSRLHLIPRDSRTLDPELRPIWLQQQLVQVLQWFPDVPKIKSKRLSAARSFPTKPCGRQDAWKVLKEINDMANSGATLQALTTDVTRGGCPPQREGRRRRKRTKQRHARSWDPWGRVSRAPTPWSHLYPA